MVKIYLISLNWSYSILRNKDIRIYTLLQDKIIRGFQFSDLAHYVDIHRIKN